MFIGIRVDIWEKTNADDKGSATFEFTSLLGNDKKNFLENFQANFQMPCITQPQKQLQQYGNNLRICAH